MESSKITQQEIDAMKELQQLGSSPAMRKVTLSNFIRGWVQVLSRAMIATDRGFRRDYYVPKQAPGLRFSKHMRGYRARYLTHSSGRSARADRRLGLCK